MIILKGLLGLTYEGIATIRGYAPIRDIIKCSKPGDFQRSIIEEHKKSLIEFYREGKDVFFPEIILALELTYDYTKDEIPTPKNDWYSLLFARKKFKSNVDNYEIWVTKARGKTDWSLPASIRIMEEPEEGKELMLRIDGNHRLIAFAEFGNTDERILDKQIPFCVTLLYPDKAKRIRKTLFHNINSKAVPLKDEFLLDSIIKDNESFPDERLKEADFGNAYLFVRNMCNRHIIESLTHLKSCLKDPYNNHPVPLTFFKELYDLIDNGSIHIENTIEESIKDALTQLESFLQTNRTAWKSCSLGLLQAFIYYYMTDNWHFAAFKTWILENQLFRIPTIKGSEIITVFNAILDSISKTIFIAMPFYTTTNKTYKNVKEVINNLNQENPTLGLELRPLRIDKKKKGNTFDIVSDILSHIEECGLMLADLTFGNANVYYEIGYKMGLEQNRGNRFKNLICFHVGIDSNYPKPDVDKDVLFDLKHLSIVKAKNYKEIKAKLKEQICIRYKLKMMQYE